MISSITSSANFFGPGYGFWKELRSVERGKIELSREYKNLKKKPNGYTSWIGHSSFIINNFDLNIITDPIFSERASPFSFFGPKRLIPPAIDYEDLPNIDVIVISHNHYDHLDKKTIKNLNRINPDIIYLVPLKLKKWFQSMGIKNVYEFNWWEEKKIKELMDNAKIESGIYNIADDTSLSTIDLVQIISEVLNKPTRILKLPKLFVRFIAKVGDCLPIPINSERLLKLTENYEVSNVKIKNAIQKKLPLSSIEGIRKTIASF